MDTLLRHLDAWRPFRALVVGDFMLDELVYGDAERLSADAPVPVLRVRRTERTAGGAASLTLDLAAMHGRVAVFGVTGDDAEGRVLRDALQQAGVETAGLITDPSRPTTLKRNLVGLAQQRHPQKMFRVDHESCEALGPDARRRLLAAFDAALDSVDVVCVEDYDKGVCDEALCREVIRRASLASVPVFVDPARVADYSKYAGANAIT
ncbi:MAG TPA: PfkB family carbohydrate kinase, partial [Phycisphaerales bacterium]|nr:PfkB family carbohydrate kinase [Phycisphaerales bacterium]